MIRDETAVALLGGEGINYIYVYVSTFLCMRVCPRSSFSRVLNLRASWGPLESKLTSWHAVRLVVYFPSHILCTLFPFTPFPYLSLFLSFQDSLSPSIFVHAPWFFLRQFSEDYYFLSLPLITSRYCYATRLFPTKGDVVGPNGKDGPKMMQTSLFGCKTHLNWEVAL